MHNQFGALNRFIISEEKIYNIAKSISIGIYIAVGVIRHLCLQRGF